MIGNFSGKITEILLVKFWFFGWIIFLGFTFYELNFIRVLVLCLDCLEILVLRDDMFLGFAYNLRPKVDILDEREQSSTMWQSRL